MTCWLSGKDAHLPHGSSPDQILLIPFATEFIEFSKNYLGETELSPPVNVSRGAFLLVVSKRNHHIKETLLVEE